MMKTKLFWPDSTTGKALRILALPLLEVGLLGVLYATLGVQFPLLIDQQVEVTLAGLAAFFVFIYALEKTAPLVLQVRRGALVLNAVCFCALVLGGILLAGRSVTGTFTLLLSMLLLLLLGSAFCGFVEGASYIRNPNRAAFFPCLLMILSVYFSSSFEWGGVWQAFAPWLMRSVEAVLALLPEMGIETSLTGGLNEQPRLAHAAFTADVGKECSGFAGFFFFSQVSLIVLALRRRFMNWAGWGAVFLGGLIWMYQLNLCRIVVLFLMGVWFQGHFEKNAADVLFSIIVHPYLGLLLYSVGIAAYFSLIFRVARWAKRERSIPRYAE